jgi:hypothetical protein
MEPSTLYKTEIKLLAYQSYKKKKFMETNIGTLCKIQVYKFYVT